MGKGIKEFKKNINEATNEINDSPKYEPRLTQAELDQRRSTTAAAPEEVRPEPKRLI
jgi:Sec-independent protein translocase protein TatA